MRFKLFSEVMLLKDIPEKRLKKGDIGTIVDFHHSSTLGNGYSLEIFNAVGDTIDVVIVSENEIDNLKINQVLSVRSLEAA